MKNKTIEFDTRGIYSTCRNRILCGLICRRILESIWKNKRKSNSRVCSV